MVHLLGFLFLNWESQINSTILKNVWSLSDVFNRQSVLICHVSVSVFCILKYFITASSNMSQFIVSLIYLLLNSHLAYLPDHLFFFTPSTLSSCTAPHHEDDKISPWSSLERLFSFFPAHVCVWQIRYANSVPHSYMLPSINLVAENPCPESWLNMHKESDLTSSTHSLP